MPYLLLTLAACFWGGNYVVGHLLVRLIDPVVLSSARWILTAILLVALYHRQINNQWVAMRRGFHIITMLALFGQVLFPLTLYIGLQYTSSLNAAIYLSTTPALVLMINKMIFKEKISAKNVTGVIISSFGVVWLILQGDLWHFNTLKQLNRGDLWTMGSAASWAVYCAFLRIKPRDVGGNAFVAISATIGAVVLAPVLFFSLAKNGMSELTEFNHSNLAIGLLYLIIFPSWLAYLLWNKGIQVIGATRGEVFSHIIPLSGGLFSVLFLNAPLHFYHLVSMFLIICGIALCSGKSTNKTLR
ncbi:DMT family transporter [Klebsiella aerogenes]|uniref:DMT family transporter n=1 Tax=Klebsiella aerogenes TaxID=548 RepID=UPI003A9008FE